MRSRGIVILDARPGMAANGRDNAAFGHDLDPVTQARRRRKGISKHRFGPIIAVDIGLIHGGDALHQAGLDLGLHMGGAGVRIGGDAPHAIGNPADRDIIGNLETVHIHHAPFEGHADL